MTPARLFVISGCVAMALAAGTMPVRAQTPAPAPAPVASTPPVVPALPTADEVLKKYRAAIGGEEALRKYTARSVRGTFEIPAQGMKGDLSIMAAAPDLIRVLVTLPGLGELQRGYNGKFGWSIDPAIGPRLLEGSELAEFKHSAEFYEDLHEPAKFKSIKVVGKTLFEGQDCYEVKLVRDSGFEYTEFFSVATGLLVGGKLNASSQMGSVPVTSVVTDYKAFGGVLMPRVTRQRMMGLEQVTTIISVTFDPIAPQTFELPPAIAALAAQKK
jgi:hypothetical protein